MTRRAVVTGIGIAAPNGLGPTAYWRALMAGQSGIRRVTKFDISKYRSKLGGEIPDFAPDRHLQDRILPQSDHITRLSLVATDWALRQAGVRNGDVPTDGGRSRRLRRRVRVRPARAAAAQPGPGVRQRLPVVRLVLRGQHGPDIHPAQMHGPGAVVISEQAGGIDAIGHARRQLRDGANLMLTGGIDSALCPWAWVAHQATGRISCSSRPAAGLPALRRARGRLCARRGRLDHGAGDAGDREEAARQHDLRRDRRIRLHLRLAQAGPPAGPATGHRDGAGRRAGMDAAGHRRRLRRRGGRARTGPGGGRGDQDGLRAPGRPGRRAQDHDRAAVRRRSLPRRRHGTAVDVLEAPSRPPWASGRSSPSTSWTSWSASPGRRRSGRR